MRIPRSIQLFPSCGIIHQYWRCHNKEYYLNSSSTKSLYLQSVKDALKSHNKESSLKIQAYACMDNHFHSLMNYTQESSKLSNFLRQAHSLFGARYNKIHNRSGKVAEGRPKTSLIENDEHQIRVHFYIEANPIRSGKCTELQLRAYKYSSYRFYAYGIKDEFSGTLTIPNWYLALGITAKERQAKYRTLFNKYLDKNREYPEFFSSFIGSPIWQINTRQFVIQLVKEASITSSA